MLFTLDASVFVAACRSQEPGHSASRTLLDAVEKHGIPLIEPTILSVEIAGALSRTGESSEQIRRLLSAINSLPHTTFVNLDSHLARRAEDFAVRHQLRGADAIYVATASLYDARLVSLDREHLKFASSRIRAMDPAGALKRIR